MFSKKYVLFVCMSYKTLFSFLVNLKKSNTYPKSAKKIVFHQCHYCTYTTTRSDSLKVHVRRHTGEKPYQCDICLKFFSDNSNFRVHYRCHTGERPYSCMHCEKSFTQKVGLQKHKCSFLST